MLSSSMALLVRGRAVGLTYDLLRVLFGQRKGEYAGFHAMQSSEFPLKFNEAAQSRGPMRPVLLQPRRPQRSKLNCSEAFS